jgi:putative DNA primase/helicase
VASITVVNIAKLPAEMIERLPEAKRDKFDVVDFIQAEIATEAIRSAAEAACEQAETDATEKSAGGVDDDRAIRLLAGLSPLDYDRAREVEAERLGVRVSTLDCVVKAARQPPSEASDGVVFVDVEPSDARIDAAGLLDEIRRTIRRFIVCEPEVAVAVALWITFTWLIGWVEVAPLLVITAPEMRCGKSQLLSLVGFLSYRPLPAISSAAVFRVIDAHAPTLILDEADTFMKENEERRRQFRSHAANSIRH